MKGVTRLLDFYLYSSLNIALGAAAMCFETTFLTGRPVDSDYLAIIFSSTMCLYALHRLVGITQLAEHKTADRFLTIVKMEGYIRALFILAFGVTLWLFIRLPTDVRIMLGIAGFVSIAYTLPLPILNKRLRDLPIIKIFVIASIWSYVTWIIPAGQKPSALTWIVFFERFLFLVALTIPFDIRDMRIDGLEGLQTLPQVFGTTKSYGIILFCMISCGFLALALYFSDLIPLPYLSGLLTSYLLTMGAIILSAGQKSDYYFSGLLDGMFLIRLAVIYAAFLFFR